MAELSYPFTTSQVRAAEWQDLIAPNAVDGVLLDADGEGTTGLQVSGTPGTWTLTVTPGRANIRGFAYQLTTPLTLTIPTNTDTSARFDRVVLRLERDQERVTVKLLVGTPGNIYQPPEPANGAGNIWELPLAQYAVDDKGIVNTMTHKERTLIGNGLPHVEYPWRFRQRGRLFLDRTKGSLTRPVIGTIDIADPLGVNTVPAVVADLGPVRQFAPYIEPTASGVTATCQWRMVAKDVAHVAYTLTATKAYGGYLNIGLPVWAAESLTQTIAGAMSITGAKLRPAMLHISGSSSNGAVFVQADATGNDLGSGVTVAANTTLTFTGTYLANPKYVWGTLQNQG